MILRSQKLINKVVFLNNGIIRDAITLELSHLIQGLYRGKQLHLYITFIQGVYREMQFGQQAIFYQLGPFLDLVLQICKLRNWTKNSIKPIAISAMHQGYFTFYQGIKLLWALLLLIIVKKLRVFKSLILCSHLSILTHLQCCIFSVYKLSCFSVRLQWNCKNHIISFGSGGTQYLLKYKDNFDIYGVSIDFWKPHNKFCQRQEVVS